MQFRQQYNTAEFRTLDIYNSDKYQTTVIKQQIFMLKNTTLITYVMITMPSDVENSTN